MDKYCHNCKYALYEAHEPPCTDCGMDDRKYWKPKPQTNADRIRAMSDEEIAEHLIQYRDDWGDYIASNGKMFNTFEEAKAETLRWLKQPADGED